MVDVEAGLKYPLGGDETLKLHAVGGGVPAALNVATIVIAIAGLLVPLAWLLVLPLVPVQLVIGVLWTGYFLRVARDTFDGGTEPPGFGDWGGLVRDGLRGFLVVLAYQVPAFVLVIGGYALAILFVYGASLGVQGGAESAAATAGVVGVVVMLFVFLLAMVYSIAMVYLLPISLVAYADEGRLGAAFSLDTLKSVGTDGEYVKSWAVTFGVYTAAATVVSFLAAVLLGYLLVPFLPILYFYLGTAGFYMFAQSYAGATGIAIPEARSPDEAVDASAAGGARTRPDDV